MTSPERTEPHLDDYATHATGYQLEDLSKIATVQGAQIEGVAVPHSAIALLQQAVRGRLSRRIRDEKRTAFDALVAVGLLTSHGKATEDGERVGGPWHQVRAMLRVDAQCGRTTSTLQCWIGRSRCVVAAGAPVTHLADPVRDADPNGRVQLDLLGLLTLPVVVASWVGLGPAWTFGVEPETVPRQLFETRLTDPSVPAPPEANEHLRRAWAQPWVHWQLSAHPSGHGIGYVHAGSAGQLHVHPSEDGARMALVDRPPMLVWRDLLHLIEGCLAAPS